MNRRLALRTICALAALVPAVRLLRAQEARLVQVTVKKFTFTPSIITLARGEPVILEFTTEDVLMGFSCYDLAVRTDIVPGRTNRVSFTPEKAGSFDFLCDIYCGEDHEDMQGRIVVT